jgi:hypothetical protein
MQFSTVIDSPRAIHRPAGHHFDRQLATLKDLRQRARQELRYPFLDEFELNGQPAAELILVAPDGPQAFEATKDWLHLSLDLGMTLNMAVNEDGAWVCTLKAVRR